mgnify:CR=1 FL=1
MSGHFQLLESLRSQGHRLTPQREMVILALHEADGHLSADDIYTQVQARNPYVDRSTVYRTLEWLRDMGLVSQVQLVGDTNRYELAVRSPHHHLACKGCRRVFDIDPSEVDELGRRLRERYGFAAEIDHLLLEGYCADCAAERARLGA